MRFTIDWKLWYVGVRGHKLMLAWLWSINRQRWPVSLTLSGSIHYPTTISRQGKGSMDGRTGRNPASYGVPVGHLGTHRHDIHTLNWSVAPPLRLTSTTSCSHKSSLMGHDSFLGWNGKYFITALNYLLALPLIAKRWSDTVLIP